MIKECTQCPRLDTPAAKYQNKRYGLGKRVHNEGAGSSPKVRCTVCGNEKGQ